MKKSAISTQSAFTLIELSIVLVIIGLVIGGVLVGKDLIKSAELNKLITEIQRYEAARITFRTKYNCLPGDCNGASSLGLGSSGNGNGYVDHYAANDETWLFWQHLASTKLIGGNFTGTNGPANSSDAVVNVNVPESAIANVGYGVYCRMPTFTSWLTQFGLPRSLFDMTYVVAGMTRPTILSLLAGFYLRMM